MSEWHHVEKLRPPEDEPILAVHSEYANPLVMIIRGGRWWIAHASGALGTTAKISAPLHWTWLPKW
jgi:hypothetical protein